MSTATHDRPTPGIAPQPVAAQQTAAQLASLQQSAQAGAVREDGATRVYRGRTVEELIPKIQAELGADAIVVRREKGLTGGIAGFFQRPFVEIEAKAGTPRIDLYDEQDAAPALPPALPTAPAATLSAPRAALPEEFRELTAEGLLRRSSAANGSLEPTALQVDDPFAAALAEAEAAVCPTDVAAPPAEAAILLAREATGTAEAAVLPARGATGAAGATILTAEDLLSQSARPAAPAATGATQASTEQPPPAPTPTPRGRARGQIEASLLGFGVGEPLVRELIETAAAHVLPLMPARSSLARAVHRTIAQRIPSASPLPVGNATIALVGPGGSGKTACCAALLEAYRERSTLPAACATVLAGAARGELEVLFSPTLLEPTPVAAPQVAQALSEAREAGLLLLDLPALSPADRGSIRAFATLLGSLAPDRVIVALPATLGAKQAAQLLEALRPLGASALAITHADETDQLGVAVEAACAFGLAPEYLLDRGRGRGGLIQIDPAYLADRLLP
jgi:flagellar biosynthesis GTPase FlhF